jgi:hypothetical protein
MQQAVQRPQGIFVTFYPEMEFVILVRNNPDDFSDAVGNLL